jgi:DNA-binding NarL/FixJ family response regulator
MCRSVYRPSRPTRSTAAPEARLLADGEAGVAGLVPRRALTDLGAALRRGGRRIDSRTPLRQALDLAHRCGANALAERARTELAASGAQPRRAMLTGLEALTPSERRVAEVAASGMTNRDIAQALFVTRRTVEIHLTHSYQKLEIGSRDQLADALRHGSA